MAESGGAPILPTLFALHFINNKHNIPSKQHRNTVLLLKSIQFHQKHIGHKNKKCLEKYEVGGKWRRVAESGGEWRRVAEIDAHVSKSINIIKIRSKSLISFNLGHLFYQKHVKTFKSIILTDIPVSFT